MLRMALVGATVAVLAAPSLAQAQAALEGAEIVRLVAGKSATWQRPDGRSGSIVYHRDGRLVSHLPLFGRMTAIEGTWQVRGDRFCRTIRMDPTPTRCQSVVRVSGKTYRFLNEDGSLATTTTFR